MADCQSGHYVLAVGIPISNELFPPQLSRSQSIYHPESYSLRVYRRDLSTAPPCIKPSLPHLKLRACSERENRASSYVSRIIQSSDAEFLRKSATMPAAIQAQLRRSEPSSRQGSRVRASLELLQWLLRKRPIRQPLHQRLPWIRNDDARQRDTRQAAIFCAGEYNAAIPLLHNCSSSRDTFEKS